MTEWEELKNHLAREIMQEVDALAKQEKISKKAAYYAFFGVVPKDATGLSDREMAIIKKNSGMKQIDMQKKEQGC